MKPSQICETYTFRYNASLSIRILDISCKDDFFMMGLQDSKVYKILLRSNSWCNATIVSHFYVSSEMPFVISSEMWLLVRNLSDLDDNVEGSRLC